MKTISRTMMTAVLLVVALTVSAQKLSKQQQEDAMINLFARATLVNGKFAITREPITYYDYWAATGEKAHGPNTSVTNAAIVSDGKKQKMVNAINSYFGERVVSLATNAQIDEAHKKIGLHRELGENSINLLSFCSSDGIVSNDWSSSSLIHSCAWSSLMLKLSTEFFCSVTIFFSSKIYLVLLLIF